MFGISMTARNTLPVYQSKLKQKEILHGRRQYLNHSFASPGLLHFSPCRTNRPASWNSLTSRLSTSHNSLVTQFQADDSNFITQAISHDILSSNTSDITDMYNVPCDSDIYAVPVDTIQPSHSIVKYKGKKPPRSRKRCKSSPQNISASHVLSEKNHKTREIIRHKDIKLKRHSLPTTSCDNKFVDSDIKTLHLTLKEIREYLHTFYSSSSDSDCKNTKNKTNDTILTNVNSHHKRASKDAGTTMFLTESNDVSPPVQTFSIHKKAKISSFKVKSKNKNNSNEIEIDKKDNLKKKNATKQKEKTKMSPVRILSINIKQSFCNLFRWRKQPVIDNSMEFEHDIGGKSRSPTTTVRRALPPLPQGAQVSHILHSSVQEEDIIMDFATSIQKVKDYAWYWGNISGEAAEKILSNEPDGSFIVRDSSDDHYIFTLTFKLNGMRHVRIEHNQGNFCFGGCTMFKAQTIVQFIENAVETSRSGRYLFFLNLRPMLGPVRVQLLYPVSRFKRVQSLQHMCRFVILKNVRRDLISTLPLPRRLLDYLSATHYYSEVLAES